MRTASDILLLTQSNAQTPHRLRMASAHIFKMHTHESRSKPFPIYRSRIRLRRITIQQCPVFWGFKTRSKILWIAFCLMAKMQAFKSGKGRLHVWKCLSQPHSSLNTPSVLLWQREHPLMFGILFLICTSPFSQFGAWFVRQKMSLR